MKGKSLIFRRKLSATPNTRNPHYRMVLPMEIVKYLNLAHGEDIVIEVPANGDYVILRRGE